jgi:hypothetical protein
MAASGPKREFRALAGFTKELVGRYLQPHLGAATLGTPSRKEELDVAAFAVLLHGAMENFAEGLSIWILGKVEKNWLKKRVSRSTVCLLLDAKFPIDHETETRNIFNLIRDALALAKSSHSTVVEKNNGIAVKHLRSLFVPLGVDVPTDPILVGSLDTLVKMRHTWAHQYRFGAKTVRSAVDAEKVADDCLRLAERLANAVAVMKL